MSSLIRLECQQKDFLKSILRSVTLLFLFYSFGIETTNTFMNSCSSPENQTRFQTKMSKFYTRSDQYGTKTIPLGAAHSYMAHMREYSPHPSGLKATWKWSIHKALHIRLSQTSYLQNHFSRHSILLQVKVFLSLFLPFLKNKKKS